MRMPEVELECVRWMRIPEVKCSEIRMPEAE